MGVHGLLADDGGAGQQPAQRLGQLLFGALVGDGDQVVRAGRLGQVEN